MIRLWLIVRYLVLLLAGSQFASAADERYLELSDGEKLYYQKSGDGSNVIVISALAYTEPLFKALNSTEYTIIAYDPRGRGRSSYVEDGSSLSIKQDVADLDALIRNTGASKVNLIGFSFAGRIMLAYASAYPTNVDRLALVAPAPRSFSDQYSEPSDDRSELPPSFFARLEDIDALREAETHVKLPQAYCYEERSLFPLAWASTADKEKLFVPFAQRLCQLNYVNEWPAYFDRYRELTSASRANLFTDDFLDNIQSPTLLIHGSRDRNAPLGGSRFWAWRLPTAKLIIEQGQAHGMLLEKPTVVAKYLNEFFGGTWPEEATEEEKSPLKAAD